MVNYKVVDAEQLDNDLRSIADTIRAKNGTTEDINFPEGYIAAYESTSTIIENVEANLNFANGDQTESLPEGYAARSVKIKKPENLTPENIAEGVEIAGIVGTHEGGCDHNIIEHIEIALDFSNGDQTETLPEGYSVSSATILKPDTLIPENIAKDVEIAGIIGTHEGGGSVEGTATVTFCNYDGSVLFERLVFIGDDCASPVTQGKLDTPTRASDVQYNYTFSGWSDTQGGTASSTVLNNITADKTVYAAYTTSLVYYTVRFYDGDTLMQESQVGYGQTAIQPDVAKEGYKFVQWTPSDLTITGDTDFYGTWTEATYLYALATPTTLPVRQFSKMVYTKNSERLIGISSISNVTKNMYIYDTTTNPYTVVSSNKTISGTSSYASGLTMHPNGTMFVISHKCADASTMDSYKAYRVYSVNGNTIKDVTNTYYAAPSLSIYGYNFIAFNSDGTRLLLGAGTKLVVFDTTTTPFTEIASTTSANHSLSDSECVVASKGDPNVMYFSLYNFTHLGKMEIDTLTSTAILYKDTSYSGKMFSNAQDKFYVGGSGESYVDVYPFDNTTHTLSDKTQIKVDNYPLSQNSHKAISPDDKKLVRIGSSGMMIFNLENNSFSQIAPPDKVITGKNYSSVTFDESGTKLAVSMQQYPYLVAYVADPEVNQ